MKRTLLVLLLVSIFLAFAIPGWALNMAPYGDEDTLLKLEDVNSGYNNELAWINAVTGENYNSFFKNDYSIPTISDIGGGYYAFELTGEPDYFYIKFGDGGGNFASHALWENNDSDAWAFINLSAIPLLGDTALTIKSISAFSHYGEAGGTTPVPEPSTILLLGIGMVGIAGIGRKKIRS